MDVYSTLALFSNIFINWANPGGELTEWSPRSGCEASCRNGTEKVYRYSVRQCLGGNCVGDLTVKFECEGILPHSCPVDGGWSVWNHWTPCSQSCGGGERHHSRFCDNPVAAKGGRQCSGNHQQLEMCNVDPCPVNCTCKPWSDWTECETCSKEQYRGRECIEPKHDGERCPDNRTETRPSCHIDKNICAVDGGWTTWNSWTKCPRVPCNKERGTIVQKRTCTNPEPKRGGNECPGRQIREGTCTTWDDATCRLDASWADWGNWTTMADSVEIRTRICNTALNGGNNICTGEARETREVNVNVNVNVDVNVTIGKRTGDELAVAGIREDWNDDEDDEDGSGSGSGSGNGDITDDTS